MGRSAPSSFHFLLLLLLFLLSVIHPTSSASSFSPPLQPSYSLKGGPRHRKEHSHRKDDAHRKVARAQRYLKTLNKAAVRSVQSPDGDIIDCVLKEKQRAFDHPLLGSHQIQDPPALPNSASSRSTFQTSGSSLLQLWHQNGSCPLGTIPVRRTTVKDLLRAGRPTVYGRKSHGPARKPQASAASAVDGGNHEHAIAYIEGEQYFGARAVLNVWDPAVESANEFSLSQLWVLGGTFDGRNLNSVEAGWQVSPGLYGDGKPRLFTYWTNDAYQATGCYNLLCSGFVQTNNAVAIGAAIAPVSTFGGNQYQIEIMIWKDPRGGNWWLAFGGSQILGYWPSSLFSRLSNFANVVEWGGEVVNSNPNGIHTSTQMGSGRFAEGGYGAASFFHSLEVVDSNNNLQSADSIQTLADHPHCYDIRSFDDDPSWGTSFYYGGPGRNAACP